MKNCGEPVVSEEAGHRVVFESCSLLPFMCSRGQICLVFPLAGLLLGKALVAGEVATRGYLALTAVSLCQGLFSLGINPQHTYVMAEEQSGARPPLWNSCFSSLWL